MSDISSCKYCGSKDLVTDAKGNQLGLYCTVCGRWQKWLGKDEALAFQYNQAGKKQKRLTKRTIKVIATYDLDDNSIILPITPKETVKKMVKEEMEDYFGDDEGYIGVEVEVIDE